MKMIHYLLGAVLLSVVFTGNIKAQVSNENEDGVYKIDARHSQDYVPGQVLFKLKDGQQARVRRAAGRVQSAGISSLDAVLKEFEVQDMEQLLPEAKVSGTPRRTKAFNGDMIVERDLTQLYRVVLPEEKADKTFEMIEQLQKLDEVEFAEPNYKVFIMADDNIAADYSGNPMVNEQWYLDAYGVKELWNKPIINKTRPVIAIIDTGVDITHPDLKDNIWTKGGTTDEHGYDFINNTTKMRDNNKHGTHVAGIAAAANNGVGIVGANPKALIMPITVMQSDGTGDVATIVKGIDYAVKNGANVINMSIGGYYNSNAERQALEKAYQSAVLVAAAGNEGKCIYASHLQQHDAAPCFPAAYSFVLGVQATVAGGELAPFSNYDDDGPTTSCEATANDPDGFNYELKAPGTKILSCIPGGSYKELQGTSMASPLVAGAISALVMVKEYDNQEILWGDLLHTNNIAEAYNVTARPAELDLTRIVLRDRNELAEYDGEANTYLKYYEVNVSETLKIFPVIRSSFGKASNIKLKIKVPAGVEVIQGEVDFGFNLDAFGNMTSKEPLVIKVPDEMPNASIITVTIQATCDESSETFSCSFDLRVCNMYTLKGLITEDMTLTADHVYYVSSNLGVDNGTTLTIEPGTRLEFADNSGLYSFGKLNANGTPEKPIVFTAYNKAWAGIFSHAPSSLISIYDGLYTNNDSTLFTLKQTELTPNKIHTIMTKRVFYGDGENEPSKAFNLQDYMDAWENRPDLTYRMNLMTDPNYLTPAVLKLLDDWRNYCANYSTQQGNDKNKSIYVKADFGFQCYYYAQPVENISYCKLENYYNNSSYESNGSYVPRYFDCLLYPVSHRNASVTPIINGERIVLSGMKKEIKLLNNHIDLAFSNIINNEFALSYQKVTGNNYFNNHNAIEDGGIKYKPYILYVDRKVPDVVTMNMQTYLGTTREDLLRPYIYESGNSENAPSSWGETLATLDLSNILKEPIKEAHGIVWKVVVNDKDAQDEQEELLPLGVGKHKFEVYFNRPMNKSVIPQISFGVISPYTQHSVSEDGSWNDEGTIYTAYVTIDGKTQSDGMNRIYVHGAEDNEFFPCPYEATRFNVMVQAAGSMASGFQADAGLGCVNLTWNNENNDFEDAMGFNVYRYTQGDNGVNDTIRINEDVLDISATSYIDDNVTSGQTYYYYYKVLSTALQEYDVSNVVAATPLTATRGDANGSGAVDVADVVTTVNYVTGLQPKPFVFDAADMNADKLIDIFDVVGIVRGILDPSLLATASLNDEPAIYSVENGVLYVESSVALGGVQVQLTLDGRGQMEDVRVAEDLDGFETASAWLSDMDYLFLAYSMNGKTLAPGKHALLHIGDADITSLRLSDTTGKNVNVSNGDGTTGIDRMGKHVMNINGVYDLQGRKLSSTTPLKNGIYIINGKKVVK